MAYKVNGNVIIDDNGDAVGLTNFAFVNTPTNVSPTDGDNTVSFSSVLLEASDYQGLYVGTIPHKFSQFQVANASSFATANIVYDSGNIAATTSNTIPFSLEGLTEHYWRVRYVSNADVVSDFSDSTSFTTTETPPSVLGQTFGGGYYTGAIDIGGGTCYYLIVAPNATGCAFCAWKTSQTDTPGTCSTVDGYLTTYTALNNADHPAGNWTATRTISSFSDWYMPALNELNVLYTNKGSMPAGEGYAGEPYWASTQNASLTNNGCRIDFAFGAQNYQFKIGSQRTRAVRRISFSDF